MEENIRSLFAKRVKQLRVAQGISQEEFAKKCGLHRTYISDIERSLRNISLDNIKKIADALEIEARELMDFRKPGITYTLDVKNTMLGEFSLEDVRRVWIAEGLEKGRVECKNDLKKTAFNFYEMATPISTISKATGLTVAEVKEAIEAYGSNSDE